MAPDLIVVAAYGQLLPADILAIPRLDCLNVHPSLLPRYRGASPVASAILDGAAVTGVTVMKVDEGMDTGPIVASRETRIGHRETADELTERLFGMGADLLVSRLPGWAGGRLQASPQDNSMATVTRRLSRRDGEMDWTRSADYLARQVRAYHPWPGSTTFWQGRRLKIVEARRADGAGPPPSPGEVAALEGGVGVGTGGGVLELKRVQLESRGVTTPEELARGHPGFVGSTLGEPPEV
jgi:methionyl-tRNA formyltransferase